MDKKIETTLSSVEVSCFFNYLPVFLCSSPAWFPLHTSLFIPAMFPVFFPAYQPDLCSLVSSHRSPHLRYSASRDPTVQSKCSRGLLWTKALQLI